MLAIIPALLSSIAYSSDAIFGKLALENMSMFIFVFILAGCYSIIAICMFCFNPRYLINYIKEPKNTKYTFFALLAVIIGTILADLFMWYAINISKHQYLPITISIIHTVPVFSLLLVYLVWKEKLRWQAIFGIILTVIGCIITVFYGKHM